MEEVSCGQAVERRVTCTPPTSLEEEDDDDDDDEEDDEDDDDDNEEEEDGVRVEGRWVTWYTSASPLFFPYWPSGKPFKRGM